MVLYNIYTHKLKSKAARALFIIGMNLIILPVLLFWTLLGIGLFPAAILYMKFIRGWSIQYLTRKCIWIYGRGWQFLTGFFVIFDPPQFEQDPFPESGIIVVNHRSFFDTYCMNMLPVSDICFAVRNWPFKIPIYNLFMNLAGYLNLEKFSWQKSVDTSKATLKNKGFILFFPEGHRSTTWEMTHFYSGAFKLAIQTNTPIIPVCLTGTQDMLPKGRLYLTPARIKMKVLAPVFPGEFQGEIKHHKLKKKVREQMDEHLTQMDKPHEKTIF
ncbi:MAG: 1-acyl-sn-glycerol-3-phosphate acyltransferase [Desulfobacteraceae bacterium]|nr:1-acyl-sn-glycerol-3-phosphate acyltransferase [Desulfobacteraceae bacterium]